MQNRGAIFGIAALSLIASVAAAQNPPSQAAQESAGFAAYQKACAACHNGGDETAPPADRLQALGRDRIIRALSPGGIMAGQASALSEAERGQVAAFLTATPQRRTQLAAAAAASAEADRTQQNFTYPIRRISDPRDRATEVPGAPSWAAPPLPAGPFEFESWEHRNLRAVVVARGLNTPRAMEFLPNGDILVAERAGRLRIIRNGVLDPAPVAGMPQVAALGTATGFMDIIKHPDFARNSLLYLAYHKPAYGTFGFNVIARARWDGRQLVDVREIFVGDDVDSLYTRLVFAREGFVSPHIYFVPSIAPGQLVFYTGDKFPAWKGNIIMGAMRIGEAPRTGHLLRIVVNANGGHVRSEMLMLDLHQRIRDVEQGPDGNIWFTTDEGADSVLMRLEPGTAPATAARP